MPKRRKEQLILWLYRRFPRYKYFLARYLKRNVFSHDLIMKTLCLDGNHSYFSYYTDTGTSCVIYEKCHHCGLIQNKGKIKHNYGCEFDFVWKYINDSTCEQIPICKNCGVTAQEDTLSTNAPKNRRFEHKWGNWSSVIDSPCKQERFCIRCDERETKQNSSYCNHQWHYEESTQLDLDHLDYVYTYKCYICGDTKHEYEYENQRWPG